MTLNFAAFIVLSRLKLVALDYMFSVARIPVKMRLQCLLLNGNEHVQDASFLRCIAATCMSRLTLITMTAYVIVNCMHGL